MGILRDLRQLCLLRERAEDGHGDALLLGPAGPADAVDVIFVLLGHIIVDDAVDVVDVDAAGGNVRGDEDGELAVFEGAHGLFTLLLRDIAVDAVGVEAHADQIVAQALAHDLRVAEDDGGAAACG